MVGSTTTFAGACSAMIRRPSSSLVPSRRTTIGSVAPSLSSAVSRPLATSSQRVMPPKMLISRTLTLGPTTALQGRRRPRRPSIHHRRRGSWRAVRRPVPRRRGAHHQAGTVAEDSDIAVELDVGDPFFLGQTFLGVLGDRLLQLEQVGVPEQGVVVDGDLRVEGDDITGSGPDERLISTSIVSRSVNA